MLVAPNVNTRGRLRRGMQIIMTREEERERRVEEEREEEEEEGEQLR